MIVATADYSQIARPADASQRGWNALIARAPGDPACATELGTSRYKADIAFATTGFIASTVRIALECRSIVRNGTTLPPSGFEDDASAVTVFYPAPHALAAADLFRPGSGWAAALETRVATDTRRVAQALGCDLGAFPPALLAEVGADPSRWRMSDAGLTVVFRHDETGCGFRLLSAPTIPWTDLAPFLKRGLELPGAPDE